MNAGKAGASRASLVIAAPPEAIYEAFMDPAALAEWLPPDEMTGKIYDFDGRVGGGYRMSLFYPQTEQAFHGKTSEHEDAVEVRFVELEPSRRIVESATFVSDDPAFSGAMTIIATFEPVAGGTEVTFAFENLPPGVRPEDNEAGSLASLEKLARRFE